MHIPLLHGPDWFSGIDVIIDLISIIVVILIAVYAWRCYELAKPKKRHLMMSFSMMFLAIAFIFKIISYVIVQAAAKEFGTAIRGIASSTQYQNMFSSVFVLYAVFSLIGFFILYSIRQKNQSMSSIIMFLYFLFVITFYSTSTYFIFYWTAFMLTAFLAAGYIKTYRKNKLQTTKVIAVSFTLISISQLIFALSNIHSYMYIFAEVMQLAGYLALLWSFILVLKHAKKKG